MVKKAFKRVWIPVLGVLLSRIAFRLRNSLLYYETWPSALQLEARNIAIAFGVAFLLSLLIELIKAKWKKI